MPTNVTNITNSPVLTPTVLILGEVQGERLRQDEQWGTQEHSEMRWLSLMGEEAGKANRAANKAYDANSALALADWQSDYREHLLTAAAVAVAAVECLDRKRAALRQAEEAREE